MKIKNKLTFSKGKKKSVGIKKKKGAPVKAAPEAPPPAAPVVDEPVAAPVPEPVAAEPVAVAPVPEPAPVPAPIPVQPIASPVVEVSAPSAPPMAQPVDMAPPMAAPVSIESLKTSASLPPTAPPDSSPLLEKTMLRGTMVSAAPAAVNAPSNFKDTEDLKEQVGNYLEVCDSCMSGECEPTDVIDLIHELIMSLSLDVVSMALIDPAYTGRFKQVVSRGYEMPPTREVIECWEMALTAKSELLWDKLMNIATDKRTELAYWVVKEHLDAVGYVPIRDGNRLYGFLFVASKTQKEHSIIKSELLDACGSRLGLAYSNLYQ
ncbi:MAG: hypothetical protein KAG97_09165 [Victivallales bacterium]|nr:hypothetical protein [Victivallales bacterium]